MQTNLSDIQTATENNSSTFSHEQFSQAIDQFRERSRLKAQDDEQIIEHLSRAKSEANAQLQRTTQHYTKLLEKLKTQAQIKIDDLAKQANSLRQQLCRQAEDYEKKLAEVTEHSRYNTAQYEQIITRLKNETSEKIRRVQAGTKKDKAIISKNKELQRENLRLKQQYEQKLKQLNEAARQKLQSQAQELTKVKDRLAHLSQQIIDSERAKSRAEELNNRLVEQCKMAKAGADAEIEMKIKDFAKKIADLKSEFNIKMKSFAEQSTRLRTQAQNTIAKLKKDSQDQQARYADALEKANDRIKAFEQAVAPFKNELRPYGLTI